jgi:predicted XRE-type DNA-binding protein
MDPVEEIKRQLAAELVRAIEGWTPGQLVAWIDIDQPRVSDLRRGRLERISIARLVRWLDEMGCDVRVCVERQRTRAGDGPLSPAASGHGNSGMRPSSRNWPG